LDKRTNAVRLTDNEAALILRALRIACEDGSIYGAAEDEEIGRILAAVEVLEAKIRARRDNVA
jgi:hypothetical protein